MNCNLTISIDDLHPEKGWGCEGDESVGYLQELNKEFGCKFTLFIPSDYHGKYPLSKHKDWVEFWKRKDWVELAAHGHYHDCRNGGPGECEFTELNYDQSIDRINQSISEWLNSCDSIPKGFRMPGWLCNQDSANAVSEKYSYVAIHSHLNNNIHFNTKTLYGHDSIHSTDSIGLYGNTFMFQSHIAGKTNENNWDEKNYINFKNILTFLEKSYNLTYKTLEEL